MCVTEYTVTMVALPERLVAPQISQTHQQNSECLLVWKYPIDAIVLSAMGVCRCTCACICVCVCVST